MPPSPCRQCFADAATASNNGSARRRRCRMCGGVTPVPLLGVLYSFLDLKTHVDNFNLSQLLQRRNTLPVSDLVMSCLQFTAEIWLFPVWKTNVRHIGILLPLLIRPYHHNPHVILHQLAKLHRNRAIWRWVMVSYQFSIWQHWRHNTTSGFGLDDVSLKKAKIYQQTKFRRDNSIHSWAITTSGLEK